MERQRSPMERQHSPMERQHSPDHAGATHVRRQDLWELSTISAVRALVDKILVLCLRDPQLRCFFADCDLRRLKRSQTERLLQAVRCARSKEDAGGVGTFLSVKVRERLEEGNLATLRRFLVRALVELLGERTSMPSEVVGQALVDLLVDADPKLVLALLPSEAPPSEPQEKKPQQEVSTPERRVLGARVAPLQIPVPRRKQAFACAVFSHLPFLALGLYTWCAYRIRLTWPIVLLYLGHLLRGKEAWARPWPQCRSNWLVNNWAAYFPASLFKADPTVAWDPASTYLIGYHPHGVCGIGAALAFATDALGWREKFPGIEPRLATVLLNLRMPLLSELISWMGGIRGKPDAILRELRAGQAVIVNVGGRQEFLDASPGKYVLTVRSRKEFFRVALRHGCQLVPAFGFGENELFKKTDEFSGILQLLQAWVERRLGVSLPLFNGRSLFVYDVGPMPLRRPLTVVVGDPIRVESAGGEPTDAQVRLLQEKYIGALRRLFEEWQPLCEPGSRAELIVS